MAEALKDSGNNLLGLIPVSKTTSRIKYYIEYKKGKLPANTNFDNDGWPYIGATDLDSLLDCKLYTLDNTLPDAKPSDLLVLWDGARAGISGSGRKGKISSTIVRIRPRDDRLLPRFLYYYYKGFENHFLAQVSGTTIPHMSKKYIEDVDLVDWSVEEQKQIAGFLDEKCAEIDKLSEDIKKQIDILEEYKRSVITRAVTKGLDSDIRMKNSTIICFGMIPDHWKVCRVKDLFVDANNGIKVGPFGSSLGKAVVFEDQGEYKIYGQANLIRRDFTYGNNYVSKNDYNRLIGYKVLPGDITVSMMGTIGRCMVVPAGIKPGIMDSHLIKIRLKKNYSPKYFEYLYESDAVFSQLLLKNKGSIMTGLNSSIVKNIYFLEPPIEEQESIVSYLNEKCDRIDASIESKNEQLDKLVDYKKSIIYEYVTGKKRVKGVN